MSGYLEDYKAYYELRMLRYDGNPDYFNSYQSEKAIYTALRYAKYFDSYFGEGEFKKRFGLPEKVETNATPWNWKIFSYPVI